MNEIFLVNDNDSLPIVPETGPPSKTATLEACSECKKASYKGNFVYPGAGFDGSYIDSLQKQLEEVGLQNVHVDRNGINGAQTQGNFLDAAAIMMLNDVFPGICEKPDNLHHIFRFPSEGQQLNFIGYSYGGLVAAINAMQYTNVKHEDVDHLVLIVTPITKNNLALIQANSRIKKAVIYDLIQHGDSVRAGLGRGELQKVFILVAGNFVFNQGEGHFYYAKEGPEGEARRKSLSQDLYSEGLR